MRKFCERSNAGVYEGRIYAVEDTQHEVERLVQTTTGPGALSKRITKARRSTI